MKELSLGELGVLEKILSKTSVKKLDVPKNLRIPDWPSAVAPATLRLGKRKYLYPELSSGSGFIRLEKKMHDIEITVHKNGAFTFSFTGAMAPHSSRSDNGNILERARALFLFYQFLHSLHLLEWR